jgi:hypothetical protein
VVINDVELEYAGHQVLYTFRIFGLRVRGVFTLAVVAVLSDFMKHCFSVGTAILILTGLFRFPTWLSAQTSLQVGYSVDDLNERYLD